jgi:hypothetical protein
MTTKRMLNLSDKDLDRLSQEAAQQHEPGDIVGPRSWEKLETRLDRDLGKVNPNPARAIRRLPYYYAPALLVILGVSYYLVRLNSKSHKGVSSASPPLSVTQPAATNPLKPIRSSSNPVPSDKTNSTPTAPSNTIQYPGTADASPKTPAATARPDGSGPSAAHPDESTTASPAGVSRNPLSPNHTSTPSLYHDKNSSLTSTNLTNANIPFNSRHRHNKPTGSNPNKAADGSFTDIASGQPITTNNNGIQGTSAGSAAGTPAARSPRDPTYSTVRGPVRLAHGGFISDSALRAINLSTIRQPIRDRVLHINRSLVFGIVGGPDYASVNSLSGQRPGSTIGATVDYQFVNHLYIGTGLLFTRKIFNAFPQDYRVPDSYYRQNGMAMGVNIIKGSFTMLEVPLNLRWDFNTSDNSLFFVGVGASSYLFTRQNCFYYYNFYNPPTQDSKKITYSNQPGDLFASINFSAGAEFGISNSLSVLFGGYVKTPTRGIGFGQVDLTSVGLTFGLRYAPVISRKR